MCSHILTRGFISVRTPICSEGVSGVAVSLVKPAPPAQAATHALTLRITFENEIAPFEIIGAHLQPQKALEVGSATPAVLDDPILDRGCKAEDGVSVLAALVLAPEPKLEPDAFVFVYASDVMLCPISLVEWIKHLSRRQQRQQPRDVGSLSMKLPIMERRGVVSHDHVH